ncbi:hypothetical protein AVEN_101419-1 [Araneus ventricosus]|uniref:Uncharacterized protein n=1 Tax=Araneus ventricosus TaxID=182803 RepID=A0A4Y2CX27_ARAVE|nr:hypothetical protein AVEN_101419-1 [Araneus ventricosus]
MFLRRPCIVCGGERSSAMTHSSVSGIRPHERYFGTDHGQMMRTTPVLAPSSPYFRTTPAGGRSTYISFNEQQAQYTTDLQWNLDSNLEPSGTEVDTLPIGHHPLQSCAFGRQIT